MLFWMNMPFPALGPAFCQFRQGSASSTPGYQTERWWNASRKTPWIAFEFALILSTPRILFPVAFHIRVEKMSLAAARNLPPCRLSEWNQRVIAFQRIDKLSERLTTLYC